jgi:hypothetical protein
MTVKPAFWRPVAVVLSAINLVGVGFAAASADPWWHAAIHAGLALAFGLWAQRLGQARGGSDLARVQQQLEQQAAALQDAQATLASQSAQLAELHERVDFAERVLVQVRDRPALDTPDQRG